MYSRVKKFHQFINESLNINTIDEFVSLSKEGIINIVNKYDDSSFDEYQYDNAINALERLQNTLKSKNGEITLYRVLEVNDVESIDIEKLGNHYTLSLDNLDSVTLFDIGISDYNNLYSVTVTSPISNIDIEETIKANINYPFEEEIYLSNLESIEISEIKLFKPER